MTKTSLILLIITAYIYRHQTKQVKSILPTIDKWNIHMGSYSCQTVAVNQCLVIIYDKCVAFTWSHSLSVAVHLICDD